MATALPSSSNWVSESYGKMMLGSSSPSRAQPHLRVYMLLVIYLNPQQQVCASCIVHDTRPHRGGGRRAAGGNGRAACAGTARLRDGGRRCGAHGGGRLQVHTHNINIEPVLTCNDQAVGLSRDHANDKQQGGYHALYREQGVQRHLLC